MRRFIKSLGFALVLTLGMISFKKSVNSLAMSSYWANFAATGDPNEKASRMETL